MRTIRLHDTGSGGVVDLEPREPGKVGIYACGPTVYNRIHIGNARPFVVFSLLTRFLEHEGYDVTFVANVTDVNDKIYDAARPLGVPSADLAREMTAHYVQTPRASASAGPMPSRWRARPSTASSADPGAARRGQRLRGRRRRLLPRARGPELRRAGHRRVDDMDQGEGVEGADRKQDPLDFALWKAQKPGEDTAWDAPWGRGRPGWHIECSAMAEELLGVGFEIHGGGSDLIFPHHENEAAQTRMARGAELTRIWMHNGMLQLGGEKMAKSVGNIESLHDALENWGRDAIILLFVSSHYRQPMQYSEETLGAARTGVRRLREAGRLLTPGPSPADMAPFKERFFAALADDFRTPEALAAIWDWVRESNRRGGVGGDDLREMLGVLGLENLLAGDAGGDAPDAARELLVRREEARAARDWAEADRLRDELAAQGWQVRDSAAGPELVRAER